jgi:hypothetical protein
MHLAGHIRPVGRVFETPGQHNKYNIVRLNIRLKIGFSFSPMQVTVVGSSSTGLKDPNVHEIIPPNEIEKTMHELSENQLQEGANPFGTLKMLDAVFNVNNNFENKQVYVYMTPNWQIL